MHKSTSGVEKGEGAVFIIRRRVPRLAGVVKRDEPIWQKWITERFPMPQIG